MALNKPISLIPLSISSNNEDLLTIKRPKAVHHLCSVCSRPLQQLLSVVLDCTHCNGTGLEPVVIESLPSRSTKSLLFESLTYQQYCAELKLKRAQESNFIPTRWGFIRPSSN